MKLNTKGISLVEVLVYMVVSVFVIGYVFSTLTGIGQSYHHEKNKSHVQLTGQAAINMLARDISSTGFKHYPDTFSSNDTIICTTRTLEGTYLKTVLKNLPLGADHPSYNASFLFEKGEDYDKLEIFKAKMKDAFTLDTVVRIQYIINGGALKRGNSHYLTFMQDYDPDEDPNKKVTICHVPPGNPDNAHTITISKSAVQTHLDHHDDYLGECLDPYTGPSLVNENRWTPKSDDLQLLTGVVALKFNFSEDCMIWTNSPDEPDEINFIRIYLLLKSEKEGNIVNAPTFALGVDDDGDSLFYEVAQDNKHFYRLYERVVEIPCNGRL